MDFKITILLIIYFSLNTFIATQYYDKSEKHRHLQSFGLYFLGVPYFIVMFFKSLFWLFYSDYFQVPFFYKYYFTKHFEKVDAKMIVDLERWKSKRGNSLRDRIYKFACNLLIKRAKKDV